ncbi:19368_t:CDS:2, partial [Funneliformis geosporum]
MPHKGKSSLYKEAVSEKNISKKEEKKLKEHNSKTDQYQRFTGFFNQKEEKNIGEIEEDVLRQIEEKKKEELGEKLSREKEELKKDNPTQEEKGKLEKKEKEYNEKFQQSKQETIKNIETQLKENKLNITELDDHKNLGERILHDPLKFFIVSPLNKT